MTDTAIVTPEHADSHSSNGHHAPPPPPTGIHRFTGPGWLRALWTTPLVGFAGLGLVVLVRYLAHWQPYWYSVPLVTVATVTFPMGLLIGIGSFDYWAYYYSGKPTRRSDDHAGHGRCPKEVLLGLLPAEHGPQGDRRPVPRDDDDVLRDRRLPRDAVPRGARPPGRPVLQPADVQRAHLGARGADDLRRRRPGLRGSRQLRDPADDRCGRHGVSAPERPLVLAAPDRRHRHARRDGHARRRALRRLDVLCAALLAPAARPGVLQHGRAVGRCELDPHCAQLPRDHHHDAGARDDLLADAAARVGELLDLDARRARDALHRRLAVLRPLRPRDAHELLRTGGGRLRAGLPAHLPGSYSTRRCTS